jgi:uncharacterized protein involved in outer membrane biogenesis
MKKWLVRIGIALVALLVAGVVAVSLFLDRAVKHGVETVGPQLTKVPIKLDGVGLSLLTGSGSIKGLEVGNPEGYKAGNAIQLDRASLSLSPGTLLSDKIVIRSIRIEGPVINVEGSPGKNNLTQIRDNVQAALGSVSSGSSGKDSAPASSGKKLQVDEFILTGAKVNYTVPGVGLTVPIAVPDIKMTGLGTGPEGITAGDLTSRVLGQLTGDLVPLLTKAVSETASGAVNKVTEEAGKALKGVGDFFKKK